MYALWSAWLSGRGSGTRSVVIYGFSVLGEVMNQDVLPAFQQQWYEKTGEEIGFITSFAGSGEITDLLVKGVPVEIVILSNESDAMILMEKGVLPGPTWKNLPHGGILNRSPMVILVRPGNPYGIRDFSDLVNDTIQIIHPHPATSGGARWAILAVYGSVWTATGNANLAADQLSGIWKQVIATPVSARKALSRFKHGEGDVLITYEQEFLRERSFLETEYEVIYPPGTIFSEHTVVRLDRHIKPGQGQLVDHLLHFLWSQEAQKIFVRHGFRSVNEALNDLNPHFGRIEKPFTVNDLGGWQKVQTDIIQRVVREEILLERGNADPEYQGTRKSQSRHTDE